MRLEKMWKFRLCWKKFHFFSPKEKCYWVKSLFNEPIRVRFLRIFLKKSQLIYIHIELLIHKADHSHARLIHSANPKSRPVRIIVFAHVVRPSIRPHFSNLEKQNNRKQCSLLAVTMGLAEWIIDDTCLVSFTSAAAAKCFMTLKHIWSEQKTSLSNLMTHMAWSLGLLSAPAFTGWRTDTMYKMYDFPFG